MADFPRRAASGPDSLKRYSLCKLCAYRGNVERTLRRGIGFVNPRKFGLTVEQYKGMRDACGNRCAICRRPEAVVRGGKVKNLAIDHDHHSGKVRDLLCHKCNLAIGFMHDDVNLLAAAIEYLKKHAEVRAVA